MIIETLDASRVPVLLAAAPHRISVEPETRDFTERFVLCVSGVKGEEFRLSFQWGQAREIGEALLAWVNDEPLAVKS